MRIALELIGMLLDLSDADVAENEAPFREDEAGTVDSVMNLG